MYKPESSELLAILLPSLLMATDTTPSEWPDNSLRNFSWSSRTFQIFTVSSRLPVTMNSLLAGTSFESDAFPSDMSTSDSAVCVVRPQATHQMLSSCAFSSLYRSEYCGKSGFEVKFGRFGLVGRLGVFFERFGFWGYVSMAFFYKFQRNLNSKHSRWTILPFFCCEDMWNPSNRLYKIHSINTNHKRSVKTSV